MEVQERKEDKVITFFLRADEEDIADNLSFVHLVMMKFDGEKLTCSSFQHRGNYKYIRISIVFPDWSSASNAMAHCSQNMTTRGTVKKSYKGALPNADPGGFMAQSLLEEALSTR